MSINVMGGILMIEPTKQDAIISLVGGAIRWTDESDEIEYLSGQTPPTQSAIDTKLAELISDWDALAYSRSRQADYPDWGSQLNKIYDDGLTKWKAEMVDPVKAKWPKDNSGPV
jgi:hypothetical protein